MSNIDRLRVGGTDYDIQSVVKVYNTIADMNADIANIPNGATVFVKENSPSGLEGDDELDPTSSNWVKNSAIAEAISTLSSDLANKGTFAHKGIYAGYVTASKNYINFFVPMDLAHGASNPSVNVAITSLSAYIGTSRLSFAGYFDTSYISVNAYKYGITVEIKFLSTYSVEAPVSVYADLNITVS